MSRAVSDSPPERQSLRSSTRFGEVMRQGKRTTVGGLTVVSLAASDQTIRIGLVAGKRLGKAVKRNRIKRRIRHACRHIDFTPGWDHILIPAASVAVVPFGTLVEWLERAVTANE